MSKTHILLPELSQDQQPVFALFFYSWHSKCLDENHPDFHNVFQHPGHYHLSPDGLHRHGAVWKDLVRKALFENEDVLFLSWYLFGNPPPLLQRNWFVFMKGSAESPTVEKLPENEMQTRAHDAHKPILLSVETSAAFITLLSHGD